MRISAFLLVCSIFASTSLAAPLLPHDQNKEIKAEGLVDTLADVLKSLLGIDLLSDNDDADEILSGGPGGGSILQGGDGGLPGVPVGGSGGHTQGGDGGGTNGGKGGGPNGGGSGGGPNGGKGGGPSGGGDGGGPNGGSGGSPDGGGSGGGPNGGSGGSPSGGGSGGGPSGGSGGASPSVGSGSETSDVDYDRIAKEIIDQEFPIGERYVQMYNTKADSSDDVNGVKNTDFLQIVEEGAILHN